MKRLLLATVTSSLLLCSTASASTVSLFDSTTAQALDALAAQQNSNGTFNDYTKQTTVGSTGLPTIGYPALAASRYSNNVAQRNRWISMANRTIKLNNGNQVLQKLPFSLTVASQLHLLLPKETQDFMTRSISHYNKFASPGVSNACFQKPGCFNNYRLFNAAVSMQMLATGVKGQPGSRLYRPSSLRRSTIDYLKVRPLSVMRGGASTTVAGTTHQAATLSDPSTYPVAYHAMCTALLLSSQSRMGSSAPRGVRSASHHALWGLLGLAAPNGEISWMGRGQDQVWTLGAALYASAEGAHLFRKSDPELASRLRRLSIIEVNALHDRLDSRGFAQAPGRTGPGNQGIDHYASAVGNTGLALTFMTMARAALVSNERLIKSRAIPAETQGGGYTDRAGAHVLVLRKGNIWMAVHTVRDRSNDGRQDGGLIRALSVKNGVWRNVRHQRNGHHENQLTANLRLDGRDQIVRSSTRKSNILFTRGVWGNGKAFSSVFSAKTSIVQQHITCPRGHLISWTEYLPNKGAPSTTSTRISRAGYTVRLNHRASFRTIGHFASARSRSLVAYRISTRCSGKVLSVQWSGGTTAKG